MVSPEDSIDIVNLFIEFYNKTNDSDGSFFENINLKDPSATNHKMEMFYQLMLEHKSLDDSDIYDKNTFKSIHDDGDIYCLVVQKKLKYFSYSFISLLYMILKYKKENKDVEWIIIKT
jgi:hypothetical protein